jgi:putative tryptophan/tyrosine transport system substrate-binding protein
MLSFEAFDPAAPKTIQNISVQPKDLPASPWQDECAVVRPLGGGRMFDLRRREFMALLGGAAAAWPLAARAQQPAKPVIGLLGSSTAAAQGHLTAAFVQRLGELGWIEGRNVVIEYRWAEGHTNRLPGLADELVRLKVDVILTHNTPPTLAAKRATSAIPIVFATAGDAVSTGIVASLARPGGNVTGLSSLQPQTAGKRIEVLRELIPGLRRLAILTDVGNPFADRDVGEVRTAARTIAVEVDTFEIRREEDITRAFEAFQGRVQALYLPSVPLLFANSGRINTLALTARLPTMHGVRELVEAGGLISYGPHWPDMWRRAADFVDKILRGAKPAELPVEQPIKFELVINIKTAKAIGLTVPDKLLALADEVIE